MEKTFFAQWSRENVYLLGVIASIGNITPDKLIIYPNTASPRWLTKMLSMFTDAKPDPVNGLIIGCTEALKPLWKARNNVSHILNSIPQKLHHHFVRGAMDASWWVSPQGVKIRAMPCTVEAMRRIIDEKLGFTSEVDPNGRLVIPEEKLKEFAAYIYDDEGDVYAKPNKKLLVALTPLDKLPMRFDPPSKKKLY
jgi:hypothetical protein